MIWLVIYITKYKKKLVIFIVLLFKVRNCPFLLETKKSVELACQYKKVKKIS